MSKLNQIQKGIRELEGGAFQKLADEYLRKKGYERLNPIGSLIGSNKVRKGTPDTLVALDNGEFVFCEHTTECKRLFAKIKSDLEKCFDVKKTGVPAKKIAEIVVCHTSLLDPAEEYELQEMCRNRDVILSLFGMGPISFDLYEHYPRLAREHLGIEVDTGQVVSAEDFIAEYNKSAFSTPLDTQFCFRDSELDQAIRSLEEADLVVIKGRPGVGKTRLALECCAKFVATHTDYELRCIFNRGPDLFQDLHDHFSAPRHHLIFADDAYRLKQSNFAYILQLLNKQKGDRRIKIIATVRDYALEGIRELARPYRGMKEIDLCHFSDDEIKAIVNKEFQIANHHFLNRICEVSRGNPRVAIMAAQVAMRENTLVALRDLSSLYDEYYRSIRQDFQNIGNRDLLKCAGIVAFFRIVDRSNEELMQTIQSAFEITPDTFWDFVHQLHALEAVDLHEDEVVRVSDQVLATYLFFLATFRERVLSFSSILTYFFPRLSHRIVDVLNPILSVFDLDEIMDALRPHVDEAWRRLEASGDDDSLLQLMHLFWPTRETEILLFIRERITRMDAEPIDLDRLEAKPDSNIPRPTLLSLLGVLNSTGGESIRIVLDTLCDLLSKRPSELNRVVYILGNQFGFKHTSDLQGYYSQRSVIDIIWARTRDGVETLFVKLFITVAGNYLQTHFHSTESKGDSFVIYNFDIPASAQVLELRKIIWDRLFQMYKWPAHCDDVLKLVRNYRPSGQTASITEIVSADAAKVREFFRRELIPSDFKHCRVVHEFLDTVDFHGIEDDEDLRCQFRGEAFELFHLLAESSKNSRRNKLGFDEFREEKARRIAVFFKDVDLPGYLRILSLCREILDDLSRTYELNILIFSLTESFISLAGHSPTLYTNLIEAYLNDGNRLNLQSSNAERLSAKLVETCGAEAADAILNAAEYASKASWLFGFFVGLKPDDASAARFEVMCQLYQRADLVDIPSHMDFLLKFQVTDKRAVARVIEIIVTRAERDLRFGHLFSWMFMPHTDFNKSLSSLFLCDSDLVQHAYLLMLRVDVHGDYSGASLGTLLDLDQSFILRYLEYLYSQKEWISVYDVHVDYGPLWMREDFEAIITLAARFIFEKERRFGWLDGYLKAFFIHKQEEPSDQIVSERQARLIGDLIDQNCRDIDFMVFLFHVISSFSYERRRHFIKKFIDTNCDFEAFKRLPLEPSSWSSSGSLVPMIQSRSEFYQSLLPLLNSMELLRHKLHIEQRIQSLRAWIEVEKKKDFMGH